MREQKQSVMTHFVSLSKAYMWENYYLGLSEFLNSSEKNWPRMKTVSESCTRDILLSSHLIKSHETIQPETREKLSIKQSVANLLITAGQEDWDGENALAVSSRTVGIAVKFVDLLPGFLAPPNVSASPQGEIDFTWDISKNAMLTVSVCPSDEIAFAGVFKDLKLYGARPWTEMFLPYPVQFCFEMLKESTVSETGN